MDHAREIERIPIGESDATVRFGLADFFWRRRAVNAIARRVFGGRGECVERVGIERAGSVETVLLLKGRQGLSKIIAVVAVNHAW